MAIRFEQRQLQHVIDKHGHGQLLALKLGKERKQRQVVIKDIQRHPLTQLIHHLDLLQVDVNQAIHMTVPITVGGEEVLLKRRLSFAQQVREVEVEGRPADIPGAVVLDVSTVRAAGPVHADRLVVPDGVRLVIDADVVVAVCTAPAVAAEAETAPDAAAADEAGAGPAG